MGKRHLEVHLNKVEHKYQALLDTTDGANLQLNSLALGQTAFISVARSTIHASACKRHCDRRLNGCRSKSQAYTESTARRYHTTSFTKPHRSSQAHVKKGLTDAKRDETQQPTPHSGCCLPASHSLESNCTGEDPCGQAQVYPPGRMRQRWLQTFLQGLGTEEERAKTMFIIIIM